MYMCTVTFGPVKVSGNEVVTQCTACIMVNSIPTGLLVSIDGVKTVQWYGIPSQTLKSIEAKILAS